MSEPFLPYGRQWLDEADIERVVEVLRGDYLTTGPLVERFEDGLCAHTGACHASVVNSGTSALHAAYFAAGLGPGDEIITTPLTFAATANAALYLGATVRFVDVQPDTGNLDPGALESVISEKTKLVVPVDFAGHPADYDEINAIAKRHGLLVIADAAHSFGATYRGRKVGMLADLTELSFHPVKPVTTGEGGAVLTDDQGMAKRAHLFRTHGITREAGDMQAPDGPWYYEMHHLGFNYRLTDVQCALGLSQLAKLEEFIARRRKIAATYDAALEGLPGIVLPGRREYVEPGWHLYVIRVAGEPSLRKTLFNRLRELGLGVQVHYIPVHYHPYYRALGYERGAMPVAEDFYARAISVPIYPKMSDTEVESSIERVLLACSEVFRS
jgi:perosamine synthetase